MSADLSLKIDTPAESIEALAKEAEALKTKLEEERQKLNDVACKHQLYFLSISLTCTTILLSSRQIEYADVISMCVCALEKEKMENRHSLSFLIDNLVTYTAHHHHHHPFSHRLGNIRPTLSLIHLSLFLFLSWRNVLLSVLLSL